MPKAQFFSPEKDLVPKAFTVTVVGRKWLNVLFAADAPGTSNKVLMNHATEGWALGHQGVATLITVVTKASKYGVLWHFEVVDPTLAPGMVLRRLLSDALGGRASFRGRRINDGSFRQHDVTCHRLEQACVQGWFDAPGTNGLRDPVFKRLWKHLHATQNKGGRNFDASCRAFRALGALSQPFAAEFLAVEAAGRAAYIARTTKESIAIPEAWLERYPLGHVFLLEDPYVTEEEVVVPVRVSEAFEWPRFSKAKAGAFATHDAWFEHVRQNLLGIRLVSLYLRAATDEERAVWEGPRLRAFLAAQEDIPAPEDRPVRRRL